VTSRVLTVAEAAAALGRSRGFVRSLIADGSVEGRQRNGRWYVTARSLEAWVGDGRPDPLPPVKTYVIPGVVPPLRRRAV
jgi:hypothetical protein